MNSMDYEIQKKTEKKGKKEGKKIAAKRRK